MLDLGYGNAVIERLSCKLGHPLLCSCPSLAEVAVGFCPLLATWGQWLCPTLWDCHVVDLRGEVL